MPREFVQDPIHGCIVLEPHERDIIDSRAFQRLRRIKQLESVFLVYPGASHTRFEHSLGTMHIAGYFAENLLDPFVHEDGISPTEKDRYVKIVRLWGLLHDIGHGPFSHTFDRVILQKNDTNHEKIGAQIVMEDSQLLQVFEQTDKELNISAEDVAKSQIEVGSMNNIERALLHVLKGAYNADLIDYLLRDSYHAGTPEYGRVSWQRLILTSSIRNNEVVLEKRSKAALESFYVSRHQMYNTVYYHRTCRAANKLIVDILKGSQRFLSGYIEDLDRYVELDEESLLHTLAKRKTPAAKLVRDYLVRSIPWKMAYERPIRVTEPSIITMMSSEEYGRSMKRRISRSLRQQKIDFYVDGAYLKESPLSPVAGELTVKLWDPETGMTDEWTAPRFLGEGAYSFWVRVYYHEKYEALERILFEAARAVFEAAATTDTTTW